MSRKTLTNLEDKRGTVPAGHTRVVYKDVFEAVRVGDIEQVEIMVKNGVNLSDSDTKHKFTPLHWAAYAGALECLQFLLWKGSDPNATTPKGWTPLHIAAIRGTDGCVQALCQSGSSTHAVDLRKATPAHLAASHGNSFTLNAILRAGADANAKDILGWTPAHAAAFHGRLGCLQLLGKWGCDLDSVDGVGNTAAHLAAAEGHLASFRYLTSKATSPYAVITARNDNGDTPKMLAQQFFKEEVVTHITSVDEERDEPDEKEDLAFPAHLSAYRGDLDTLQMLVENGIVNINERDDKGTTPAHKAAGQGHVKVLQWLIEMGANMSIRNNAGETPKDVAIRFAQLGCVQMLGGNQPEPDAPDDTGGAARSIAAAPSTDPDAAQQQEDAEQTVFAERVASGIIKLSREERKRAKDRSKKRLQEVQQRLEVAKQNFIQLGGMLPEVQEQIDHDRQLERLNEEFKEQLEYERLKREKLEAQLDEYRRENARLLYELDMAARSISTTASTDDNVEYERPTRRSAPRTAKERIASASTRKSSATSKKSKRK